MSPGLVVALINLSINAIRFCVGKPILSFECAESGGTSNIMSVSTRPLLVER